MRDLQRDVTEWHQRLYPDATILHVAAKLCEEAGEVAGAVLKQARPDFDEQRIREEIGDVAIVLLRLCSFLDVDLDDVVIARWVGDVKHRRAIA